MSAIAKIDIAALTERAKNILMTPEKEWEKIDGEKPQLQELFVNYAAILAAIPAVCSFVGLEAFGIMGMHPSFGNALAHMILTYIQAMVMLAVGGFAAEFLAPQFGGKADRLSAFKLIVYSMTASWLAGIFTLLPALSMLAIVGLYSAYLFYLGAQKLMGVPKDKAVGYTAVTVIASILAGGLIMMLMRT